MRVRRLLAVLTVVAASALVVSPAAAAQARYEPRFESAPCPPTPIPLPALENARCGFLIVPENRSRPGGRKIRLAVAIVPAVAQQPAPDPLVHLTGGPGGVAILEAQALVDAGFNRDRDLILMDQRGTFFSEPALTCEVIDRFNREQVGLPLDARSTRRKHVAATRRCRRELVARGIDIAAYNTTENAADFADLRRALGYDQWNVFGVSYGTDLALTILRDHPEGLRSVILDSTVPPSVVDLSEFWPNARDGFQNIFRACTAQARCRSSFPRMERTFTNLVRRLESDPVRTTVVDPATGGPTPVVLDGGALANWLVGMSLATPSLKDLPSMIAELAAGDPQSIATSRLAQVAPPGFVGYGLAYGVICSEWSPFGSEREVLAQGRDVLPRYPRSVLAQPPQFTYMFDDCRVWDVPAAPASVRDADGERGPDADPVGQLRRGDSARLGLCRRRDAAQLEDRERPGRGALRRTRVALRPIGHRLVPPAPGRPGHQLRRHPATTPFRDPVGRQSYSATRLEVGRPHPPRRYASGTAGRYGLLTIGMDDR